MSKVASPLVVGGNNTDFLYLSPPTVKKKKVKDKTKKSKDKKKTSNDPVTGDGSVSESGTPVLDKEKKKKRKSKKFRYNSEALGVVIIPDCDEDVYQDESDLQDKSAHFSTVTDPTERTEQTTLLDDDDFTTATKEDKSTRSSKKKKKDCKEEPDEKEPKEQDSKEKRSKSLGSRGQLKQRRSSGRAGRKKSIKSSSNNNASWGNDPNGEKTFMSPELLSLLMDPAMRVDSDEEKFSSRSSKRKPALKKSNSFDGAKKHPSLAKANRRSSVGTLSVRGLDTKTRKSKRKGKKDTSNGTSNESWGVELSMANQRSSYSPELLNLYTSKKAEKPSPVLRRNVKSFNCVTQSLGNERRDSDIPSILLLHPDNSHCNLNDSWEDKVPSDVRGKLANNGYNNDIYGGIESNSPGRLSPMPLRNKGSMDGNRNETWGQSLGKSPVSAEVAAMMLYSDTSPSLKKSKTKKKSKSPGMLRKSMSLGNAIKKSPSMLRNSVANVKKGRNVKQLQDIPDLMD